MLRRAPWLLPLLLLVLVRRTDADTPPELASGVAEERYSIDSGDAVDASRLQEAERLVSAATAAIDALPSGDVARDEL